MIDSIESFDSMHWFDSELGYSVFYVLWLLARAAHQSTNLLINDENTLKYLVSLCFGEPHEPTITGQDAKHTILQFRVKSMHWVKALNGVDHNQCHRLITILNLKQLISTLSFNFDWKKVKGCAFHCSLSLSSRSRIAIEVEFRSIWRTPQIYNE
jgi:hypothetical protein